jgi:predicted nucleotidyltransferase
MDAAIAGNDLAALNAVFAVRPQLLAVVLFGSRFDGRQRFASDLDLAILGQSQLTAGQRYDLIEAISQVAGVPVDLIDLNQEYGFVAHEALTKGKLIFCRDRAAYAERLRRMVYDAEDFLPLLRRGYSDAIRQCLETSYAPK